ncbi:aldo/keto reductase [Kocuria sp. CPCC 205281]
MRAAQRMRTPHHAVQAAPNRVTERYAARDAPTRCRDQDDGCTGHEHLIGVPARSWATQGKTLKDGMLSEENLDHVRALTRIGAEPGPSMAQMAVAWVLTGSRISSVLVGASRPEQLDDTVRRLQGPDFTTEELSRIEEHARDAGSTSGPFRARLE